MSGISYIDPTGRFSRFVGEGFISAGEKVAWAELVISIVATALVFALVPWLGWQVATSGFALMALIAVFGAVFLRRRGSRVVIDERDREICAPQSALASAPLGSCCLARCW